MYTSDQPGKSIFCSDAYAPAVAFLFITPPAVLDLRKLITNENRSFSGKEFGNFTSNAK